MNNKKKILMVTRAQFGYHTDMFAWCTYLSTQYSITVICQDCGLKYIEMDGVEVIYIRSANAISKRLDMMQAVNRNAYKFHLILVDYYMGCSMLRWCNYKVPMVVDIRTISVRKSMIGRLVTDLIVTLESLCYPAITVITEYARKHLHLPKCKTYILPLGANISTTVDKVFDHVLELLYVGTLSGRRVEETVQGLSIFIKSNPAITDIRYTIVGTGTPEDTAKVEEAIRLYNLEDIVKMEGYVPYKDLFSYYQRATIGISYVPITRHYTMQPPTKTYEYLGAGMPVLATNTIANQSLICQSNGILIEDTPFAFSQGLRQLVNNFSLYKSNTIKETIEPYQWGNICSELAIYLSKKITKNG